MRFTKDDVSIDYNYANNIYQKLNEWYEKHKYFLEEKSISSIGGKEQFTHPRVRSAYRSLITIYLIFLLTKMRKIYLFKTLLILLMVEYSHLWKSYLKFIMDSLKVWS